MKSRAWARWRRRIACGLAFSEIYILVREGVFWGKGMVYIFKVQANMAVSSIIEHLFHSSTIPI